MLTLNPKVFVLPEALFGDFACAGSICQTEGILDAAVVIVCTRHSKCVQNARREYGAGGDSA